LSSCHQSENENQSETSQATKLSVKDKRGIFNLVKKILLELIPVPELVPLQQIITFFIYNVCLDGFPERYEVEEWKALIRDSDERRELKWKGKKV
jgi:hypothetical protein